MPKEFINPDTLSTPPGYSHVVKAGNLVFISGQIAVDPNGQIVGIGDIDAQARQVFANLEAAVKAGGGRKEDIVDITIYLIEREHLAAYRSARDQFFPCNPPASTLLFITGLARPEIMLEIEATAVIGD